MRKIIQLAAGLLFVFSAYGQKELWGYKGADGLIIKAPLAGSNQEPEIMHEFDATGLLGKFPKGRMLQASNGKLYGVTGYDNGSGSAEIPSGILFEYDLILNRYKVLSTLVSPVAGVIEPLPGMLYGLTNGGRSVFKYNIDTEATTIVATIPGFIYNNSNWYPRFMGELMKASDGNLYGATDTAPSSQNVPFPGGIYKFNLTNNQITKVYVFGTLGSDVVYPVFDSKLVEGAPGKLYGTAMGGAHYGPQGVAPIGSGTLYEYTISSGIMAKKFDFDYNTIGCNPGPVIKTDDKLYGALFGLSNNFNNYPNGEGSLFEYDLTTAVLTISHSFSYESDDEVKHPSGILVKGTDGNFYGASFSGNFKFNPTTNTVNKKINSDTAYDSKDLIEICRKPSYPFFDEATFLACQNTPFSFDVQNTNAVTYVWKKGSTLLPSQTTAILTIASLTLADSGIYTCTMANECGTTVTMPLQISVDGCLGLDAPIELKSAIRLYPNPAANVLNLKSPDGFSFEIQQIAISNMLGQTIYSSANKNTAIDISFLKTGMYQLLLVTDKGDWNGKFIKE